MNHAASLNSLDIKIHRAACQGGRLDTRPSPNWLSQHHYGQLLAIQPESRFWHFQLIEGGWLLVLAVLAGAAAVRLVRRSTG